MLANAAPWVAGGCALFALGIFLVVVAAPWRGVRQEGPLDEEVQTRLLLGEDPETIEQDLEADEAAPSDTAPVSDLRPEE